MIDTDFAKVLDAGLGGRWLGWLGNGLDLMLHEGIYCGEVLHRWVERELAAAGVRTWGDLRIDWDPETPVEQRYSLVVIVSDISRGRMLRLPWDFEQLLGVDPDRMPVGRRGAGVRLDPVLLPPLAAAREPAPGRRPQGARDHRRRHAVELPDRALRRRPGPAHHRRQAVGPARAGARTVDGPRRPDLHGARPRGHDDQRARPDLRRPAVGGLAHDLRRHPRGPLDRLRHRRRTPRPGCFDNGLRAAANFLVDWDYDEWRREYAGALGQILAGCFPC